MASLVKIFIPLSLLLFLTNSVEGGDGDRELDLLRVLSSPKVDERLKKQYEHNPSAKPDCMVEMEDKTTKAIRDFERSKSTRLNIPREELITQLMGILWGIAEDAQNKLVGYLIEKGLQFVQLRLENNVFIPLLGLDTLMDLVTLFPNIKLIRHNVPARTPKPSPNPPGSGTPTPPGETPWPIQQVGGRCADIRCKGDGVVVAIIDTGVRKTHVELNNTYREEYGWFEPTLDGTGSKFPYDSDFHGTHVAGIAVGATKGMARLARWIACLGLPGGTGPEWILKMCLEFAFCPCRWNKENERDCSMAPHVVVNSWGAYDATNSRTYYKSFMALRAVGILYVISAGNEGPGCTSVGLPAMYDISLAVGNVDESGTLYFTSSRGPVFVAEWDSGSNPNSGTPTSHCGSTVNIMIKPDISAPGTRINSSMSNNDTAYGVISGTSMAAPLVGGVMALMVCANDGVAGSTPLDMTSATYLLKNTTTIKKVNATDGHLVQEDYRVPDDYIVISNLECNEPFGICNASPNNLYGWGVVDACKAVQKTEEKAKNESVIAGLLPIF